MWAATLVVAWVPVALGGVTGICGLVMLAVGGLAAAMLSRPVANVGGARSREWIASMSPVSEACPD